MRLLLTPGLALAASLGLAEAKRSPPTLYCLSDPDSTTITTLDPSVPRAQCFRVEDGLFTEVLKSIPDHEEKVWLGGWVIPGLIESHGHILAYGEMLESVLLYRAESMKEVRDRIRAFLELRKGKGFGAQGKWIRGMGWDQKFFGGVMPTAVRRHPAVAPRRLLTSETFVADLHICTHRTILAKSRT